MHPVSPDRETGEKDSVASVKAACTACHKKGQGATVDQWEAAERNLQTKYWDTATALEKEVAALEAEQKRHSVPLRAVLDEISQDTNFVIKGRWSHNPRYAEMITRKIDANIEKLRAMLAEAKSGKRIMLNTNAK